MIDKTVRSVAEAMAGIKDGSTVLIAGFAQVALLYIVLNAAVQY